MGRENRKRTREETGDEKKGSRKGKKPETIISSVKVESSSSSCYKNEYDLGFEFSDPTGVFDFPWLKEGIISQFDNFLTPDEDNMFAPFPYLDNALEAFDCRYPDPENSLFPASMNLNVDDQRRFDDDELCSFHAIEFEPLDCIWNSVMDQPLPLDNCGLNKA